MEGNATASIRQYKRFRNEVSVYDGVGYRSLQGILPSSLREEMLQKYISHTRRQTAA